MAKSKDVTMCPLTAVQIESGENLPPRLQEIGKQIEAKLAKADMYQGKASDMIDSIGRLLDEAKEFCDGSGFDAFKRTFCPSLGKSRAYEMLAIASGKKTSEDVRAETRARVAKHRANKTGASHSVTVTEKSGPEAEGAPAELAPADAPSILPEQRPEAGAPRRAVTPKDDSLSEFTSLTCRVLQEIAEFHPRHFQKTGIEADELANLGGFYTELAKIKAGAEQSAVSVAQGSVLIPEEQSAEEIEDEEEEDDAQEAD